MGALIVLLGVVLGVVGLAVLISIYYGWALSVGWNLVMVKAFGLPHLSILQSMLIVAFVSFIAGTGLKAVQESVTTKDGKKPETGVNWKPLLVTAGYPLVFLLEMYIINKLL